MTRAGRLVGTIIAIGAQIAPAGAGAACLQIPAARTRPVVASFMIRPGGSLERFVRGEAELGRLVSLVVAADPKTTLGPVLDLIPKASVAQKRAIGAGLGEAAGHCRLAGEDAAARQIQLAVRRLSDTTALAAFEGGFRSGLAPSSGVGDTPLSQKSGRAVGQPLDPFAPLALPDPTRLRDPNRPLAPMR